LTPTISNTNVSKVYDGTTVAPSGFAPTYVFAGLVGNDSGATSNDIDVSAGSQELASMISTAKTIEVPQNVEAPQAESKASYDGLTVGNTVSGTEVKAIIIQGAATAPTPVTMLVSVKAGEGFSFSMPQAMVASVAQLIATSINANPNTPSAKPVVSGAVQADGKPLPSWLSFDKDSMNFNSSNVPAGGLPLMVKVIVSNGEGVKTIEVVLRGSGV
jgi:hypothetical protein